MEEKEKGEGREVRILLASVKESGMIEPAKMPEKAELAPFVLYHSEKEIM